MNGVSSKIIILCKTYIKSEIGSQSITSDFRSRQIGPILRFSYLPIMIIGPSIRPCRPITYLPTYLPIYPSTHPPIHPPTYILKLSLNRTLVRFRLTCLSGFA